MPGQPCFDEINVRSYGDRGSEGRDLYVCSNVKWFFGPSVKWYKASSLFFHLFFFIVSASLDAVMLIGEVSKHPSIHFISTDTVSIAKLPIKKTAK